MRKIIESSILDSSYHEAITHSSLITNLCDVVGVLIRENEDKCPLMQPLHYPQKKTTRRRGITFIGELRELEKKEKEEKKRIKLKLKPRTVKNKK